MNRGARQKHRLQMATMASTTGRNVTWSFDETTSDAETTSSSTVTHRTGSSNTRTRTRSKSPLNSTKSILKTSGTYYKQQMKATSALANEILERHQDVSSVAADDSVTSGSSLEAAAAAELWRKHGKRYRNKLIMRDEESPNQAFSLSNNCKIEKYYEVSEKVMDNILNASVSETSKVTQSYLIGTRLVKFLSTVLPTHRDYFVQDASLVALRNRSQVQLVQLMQYMEQLAVIIDETEWEKQQHRISADKGRMRAMLATGAQKMTSETKSFGNSEHDNSVFSSGNSSITSAPLETSFESNGGESIPASCSNSVQSHREQQQNEASTWDETFAMCGPQLEQTPSNLEEVEVRSGFDSVFSDGDELEFAERGQDGSFKTFENPFKTLDGSKAVTLFEILPASPTKQNQEPIVKSASAASKDKRQRLKCLTFHEPIPPQRESSPKSPLEFAEWRKSVDALKELEEDENTSPLDAVDPNLQHLVIRPTSPTFHVAGMSNGSDDDTISLVTNEDEVASLASYTNRHTMVERRRVLHTFKDCVRCLLQD